MELVLIDVYFLQEHAHHIYAKGFLLLEFKILKELH